VAGTGVSAPSGSVGVPVALDGAVAGIVLGNGVGVTVTDDIVEQALSKNTSTTGKKRSAVKGRSVLRM
jgi:hypothetical protein